MLSWGYARVSICELTCFEVSTCWRTDAYDIVHLEYTITVGVPQGSIIGPLLFTLCVNDVHEYVDNAVDMYVDDNTLQIYAKDI